MQFKNLVTSFVRSWNFTRSETLQILNALTDEQLKFRPAGAKWKPLYNQFSCIILTQLVYTRSIEEGRMDYKWFHEEEITKRTNFTSKEDLLKALEEADKKWVQVIRNKREEDDYKIKWPGFNQNLLNTINSLVAHERLHHGQLISYFTAANFELPPKFKDNWSI